MRIQPAILLLLTLPVLPLPAEPTLIAHREIPSLDPRTVDRIYTGKVIEVNGIRITPVNLPPGNPLRERFLRICLAQDEERYTGYWTVRRYVGKGIPPRELPSSAEVVRFVAQTAGAIGYVDSGDIEPGADIRLLPFQAP